MSKARILVVEDNADNEALVRFLLERNDYEVVNAFDGLDALKKVKEVQPDLVLMDLAIPELDGFETTKAIKADPATHNIPVVALTARTLPHDRYKASQAGCNGYISQPINIVAFIKEVEGFLAEGQKVATG